MPDPHDLDNGGHEPVDVDPFIPTGICRLCQDALGVGEQAGT
jgi:hypothetical protein